MDKYTMGKAAERLGVAKSTLYRWEKAGLIDQPKRSARGLKERIYTDADIEKIREWKDQVELPAQTSGEEVVSEL